METATRRSSSVYSFSSLVPVVTIYLMDFEKAAVSCKSPLQKPNIWLCASLPNRQNVTSVVQYAFCEFNPPVPLPPIYYEIVYQELAIKTHGDTLC